MIQVYSYSLALWYIGNKEPMKKVLNQCSMEIYFRNNQTINIYLHFLSSFNSKFAQVVTILFAIMEGKDPLTLHRKYPIYRCPAHARKLVNSKHGIDLCFPESSGFSTIRFNTLRLRRNGRHFPDDISKWIFFWMKMYKFHLRFHWNLFLGFELTIFHHWFGLWLGADQATSLYLNQWWSVYWRIYVSFSLNELMPYTLTGHIW